MQADTDTEIDTTDLPPLPPPPGGWAADATCSEVGATLFFPEVGEPVDDAKRACRLCGVREDCLEYALDNDITHGVWGGMSVNERRKLGRLRDAAAQAAAIDALAASA